MPPELGKINFPVNQATSTSICWTNFFQRQNWRSGIDFWKLMRSRSTTFLWHFLPPWPGLPLSLSGKIWGNPIKSRAPPVSNTAGIKMSGPGIGIPTGLCFPYNFNQRIRKSKNGERYIWIRQLCKYRRKRKLLRLTSVMRIKSSSGSSSFAHTGIFQGRTVLSANEQSPQD